MEGFLTNYQTTIELLEAIRPHIANDRITIRTENTDWRGRKYQSDFVSIDKDDNVGFEVFENEVIVFYFTDHTHFEDDSSELPDGCEDYIKRCKAFLIDLFTVQIRHIERFKGKAKCSEKYILVYSDGREDQDLGSTWYGLMRFINPFGKRTSRSTSWRYDKLKGKFTTRQPKTPDPDAIQVIDINDDCYIEIFQRGNVFTYSVMELEFDDEFGCYYWTPANNIPPTGLYDTKEKAVKEALLAAKIR